MQFVTQTAHLKDACQKLSRADYITVDTEFLRDRTYYPQLCLVQMASKEHVCAVDPLSEEIDLSPLHTLLCDDGVLKVFHAARQDIEIFYQSCGKIPAPIFDTQIAAMVCGFGESVGYETLVSKLAKARLDKSVRFTDWSQRPLSEKQLDYAISDVTHLRIVYEKLAEKLRKSGRHVWLEEEIDTLTSPDTYKVNPQEAWKRLKPRSRNRKFLGRVKGLAAWREQEAQRRNVPRNRVIRDDVLLKLASHPPRSPDDLYNVKDLPRHVLKDGGKQALYGVFQNAPPLPESEIIKTAKPSNANGAVVELLKVLLKHRCREEGVAQKLVATVADLEKISADDDAGVASLRGWRWDLFGRDALALKNGDIAITIDGGELQLLDNRSSDNPERSENPH